MLPLQQCTHKRLFQLLTRSCKVNIRWCNVAGCPAVFREEGVHVMAQRGQTRKYCNRCVPLLQELGDYNLHSYVFIVFKTMQLLLCCSLSKCFWVSGFYLFGFWVLDFGLRVFNFWVFGLVVWISGFRILGSGFVFWCSGVTFWVLWVCDLGFGVVPLGSGLLHLGFWVCLLGFWVQTLGFKGFLGLSSGFLG